MFDLLRTAQDCSVDSLERMAQEFESDSLTSVIISDPSVGHKLECLLRAACSDLIKLADHITYGLAIPTEFRPLVGSIMSLACHLAAVERPTVSINDQLANFTDVNPRVLHTSLSRMAEDKGIRTCELYQYLEKKGLLNLAHFDQGSS